MVRERAEAGHRFALDSGTAAWETRQDAVQIQCAITKLLRHSRDSGRKGSSAPAGIPFALIRLMLAKRVLTVSDWPGFSSREAQSRAVVHATTVRISPVGL